MKAKLSALPRLLADFAVDALSSLICIAIGILIVGQQISMATRRQTYTN